MTTGEKIAKLRKEYNYTQEQLAQLLGVSRQSISKYESDMAYPETEKLIRLGEIFDCSLDYLLKDTIETKHSNCGDNLQSNMGEFCEQNTEAVVERVVREAVHNIRNFDKRSKRMIGGLPLWHVGKNAKGIIAVGITARGVLSIGLFSMGIISFGVVSLGILAIGAFVLGLLALGSIAVGGIVCGGVCAGVLALGGLAAGDFAFGGLAVGDYFAYGDIARGMHAVGWTDAVGQKFEHLGELTPELRGELIQSMYQNVPGVFHWIVKLIEIII